MSHMTTTFRYQVKEVEHANDAHFSEPRWCWAVQQRNSEGLWFSLDAGWATPNTEEQAVKKAKELIENSLDFATGWTVWP